VNKLYYLGQPSDGFGWGVANTNLVKELSKLCEVVVETSARTRFDAPVFVPVADAALKPLRRIKTAPRTLGYCFTEWPLTDDAERNARQYDTLFAGSTWNTDKLLAAGIKQAEALIQGVDFERFTPLPPSDRKGFVVFSGGKYEFRKGQDYVLRAMRHFMQQRTDAVLLAAWHNPWPQTMASMKSSWLIDPAKPFEGLPEDRVIKIPAVPNAQTPHIYNAAHVGLFPNRCEAGTNLVMSEFMACARPVIAIDAHGHRDVLAGDGPLKLNTLAYDAAGWANTNVSDIIAHLEYAYQNREEMAERGRQCRLLAEKLSWEACAKKIVARAFQS
jgi:glycosyltransferase involved in cell wall biosynthesis